jgi:hypothetical protein
VTRPTLPAWLEFQPRDDFELCACAVLLVGRYYARSSCPMCHGGGITAPTHLYARPALRVIPGGADA